MSVTLFALISRHIDGESKSRNTFFMNSCDQQWDGGGCSTDHNLCRSRKHSNTYPYYNFIDKVQFFINTNSVLLSSFFENC